jgi:hypothetical protein
MRFGRDTGKGAPESHTAVAAEVFMNVPGENEGFGKLTCRRAQKADRKESFRSADGLFLITGYFVVYLGRRDLPQTEHDFLVIGSVFDQRLRPLVELFGTFGSHHDQQKTVGDLCKTIFYGNTCHIGEFLFGVVSINDAFTKTLTMANNGYQWISKISSYKAWWFFRDEGTHPVCRDPEKTP